MLTNINPECIVMRHSNVSTDGALNYVSKKKVYILVKN